MNKSELEATSKNQIPFLAKNLSAADINFLVNTLAEKNEALRYNAFLLLQAYSRQFSLVYRYWDVFVGKMESDNSYQRSLGLMLVAENVRWDVDNKFSSMADKYLSHCKDEKFITARQAIQGLATIIAATTQYNYKISQELTSLPLSQYKQSQQKLLNKDIANILKIIQDKGKQA